MLVHRPTFTYAIKIILPIFLIVVCAALVFYIHPTYVEGRIGMGISALLTLVMMQLTTNSQLPEADCDDDRYPLFCGLHLRCGRTGTGCANDLGRAFG